MTRIAYILKMYPRFSETFIVNEILELERQGVDIRIYSLRKPDDGRFHASLAQVKANVIYTPEYPDKELERVQKAESVVMTARPEAYHQLRTYAESRGQPYAIKRFQQACVIAAHLLNHPVDGMHAHFASSATRVANYVHHLIGLPYSFTAHAKDIYHEEVRASSLKTKIAEAHFVVTVSHYNQQHLQQLMSSQPADIRTLYNGIDLKIFRPGAHIDQSTNRILAVGRLVEKKGFDVLIEACALLVKWGVDFQCEIIGKGELQHILQEQISRLELEEKVHLVGPRPQEQVLEAYHQASIFALPCIVGRDGNRDGLPTVLLEAMATGLPVISTDLTGIPEIINHGQEGLLVEQNNPWALAASLAELLHQPARRQAMGQAARYKVEQVFDVRHSVATLREWLASHVHEPVGSQITIGQYQANQPMTPVNGTLKTTLPDRIGPVTFGD